MRRRPYESPLAGFWVGIPAAFIAILFIWVFITMPDDNSIFKNYVVLAISCSIAYVFDSKDKQYYLADLNWGNLLTWIFLFVFLWPIIPSILVSLKRMEKNGFDQRIFANSSHKKSLDLEHFEMEKAKQGYLRLRSDKFNIVERRIRIVKENIESLKHDLRILGEQMVEMQDELREYSRELGTLEISQQRFEDPSIQLVASEFETMMRLPGVKRVRVVDCDIVVDVAPVYYRLGLWEYDLGDYRLRVDTTKHKLYLDCSRSGRHDERLVHLYHDHGIPGFCFGTRRAEIFDHLRLGDYLTVVSIAVESLHFVNDVDLSRLQDYRRRNITAVLGER